MRDLLFIALAIVFLAGLCGILWHSWIRSRRQTGATWDQLLGRLSQVDRDAVMTIALDAIGEDAYHLEPAAVWDLLGGLEGLEMLERNGEVLVELACFVQRTYPEALVVAEQLRHNAREIAWHVGRLRGSAETGNLRASFDVYAQQAVVSYYRMTQQVLALYQSTGFVRLAELQAAI